MTKPTECSLNFPSSVNSIIKKIKKKEVLGARKHANMMMNAVLDLMDQTSSSNVPAFQAEIERFINCITEVRGEESVVFDRIGSSIRRAFEKDDKTSLSEIKTEIRETVKKMLQESQRAIHNISMYGANLFQGLSSLFVYDYSSSVMKILKEISTNNKKFKLIIPECRIVKGGESIRREISALNFHVHLIPDCSMGYFLPKTEAVLMGAETVHMDGSFINTIGSKQIASSASKNQVPVYVACELTKVDKDSLYGTQRKMIWRDMEAMKEEVGNANFRADYPLGICVPSKYVTGYITDIGVIPPSAIWSYCWCEAEEKNLSKEVR